MFVNNLKIAFRTLKKQKVFSAINIFGLALGLTCAMIIYLYIRYELSFDRFHQNRDRIFRLTSEYEHPDQTLHFARCANAWQDWPKNLAKSYPEILNIARLSRQPASIKIGNELFHENNFFVSEPSAFDVFTFPLKQGDARTALAGPNSIVITEAVAGTYFHEQNPMGQTIQLVDQNGQIISYKITGVMRDLPAASHVDIRYLASFSNQNYPSDWAYCYLLVSEHTKIYDLEAKLPDFVKSRFGLEQAQHSYFHLQKLTDIHLHSHLDRELKVNGSYTTIILLWLIAIFIILIACINYINLATAMAAARGTEVGIRKTLGSSQRQLVAYFLTESFLITCMAFILALILIQIILPAVNRIAGKMLTMNYLRDYSCLLIFVAITFFAGILSGLYPALSLSRFNPIHALKQSKCLASGHSSRHLSFRNGLVILQFSLSIALIIGILVFNRQLSFIRHKDLGLDKEQVLSIGRDNPFPIKEKFQALKQELLRDNGIVGVSACMDAPSEEIKDLGACNVEGVREGEDQVFLYILPVDVNFLHFMDIQLLNGSDFEQNAPDFSKMSFKPETLLREVNESRRTYILNETAYRAIGWTSPSEAIGKRMDWANVILHLQQGPIIGIVRDFHFSTLQKEIVPYVLVYEPRFFGSILVKIRPENNQSSIHFIEKTWKSFFPQFPFEYTFLYDLFAQLYEAEQQLNQIVSFFTVIALLIACLGLFGLTAFLIEQKTKEIGIRKVLGASVPGILMMLMKDLIQWVVLANLLAWPVAYYMMRHWLQNFAYRIELSIWPFVLAGISALVIALFTVSWQALRAATANPVQSLRYE